MTKTSMIVVRIDPETKEKAENLYKRFGLTLSGAISMFLHQSINVGGLPFELKDPVFRGEFNIDTGDFEEEEIDFKKLQQIVRPIAEKYGIKSVYLFGSRARGDNRPDSDYDFSIDPGEMNNALDLAKFIDDLETELGKKVDVISRRGLENETFKKKMEKEEVLVYG